MYCARCGADVGPRAVVCRSCGADLTRAGALRMTAGGLYEHAANLDLPDDLLARLGEDGRRREVAATARPAAGGRGVPGHRVPPRVAGVTPQEMTPDEDADGVVAAPAPRPEEGSRRQTIIATVLVVLLVMAAMWLVTSLAQRLMDPLPPVGPPVSTTSQTPSSQSPGPSALPS